MQTRTIPPLESIDAPSVSTSSCPVAWPSIWAGAFAAVSLSLILLILGSGFGLTSLSPSHANPSVITLTSAAVIWLIFTQWIASGLGGYMAGRLRSRYVSVHTDEMFFRDTAHGFLAWAVATVAVVLISTSAISAGLGGVLNFGAMAAHTAPMPGKSMVPPAPQGGPQANNMYIIDTLFRAAPGSAGAGNPPSASMAGNGAPPAQPMAPGENERVHGETARILMNGIKNGDVPQADKDYIASVVAARAGISQAEASKRVDDTIAQMKNAEAKAKEAAETARKTAATLSVFTALSMLVGAFIASVSGALGGKRRDEYHEEFISQQ